LIKEKLKQAFQGDQNRLKRVKSYAGKLFIMMKKSLLLPTTR